MFKGSHTDTVLENYLLQTAKRFKFSDECQIRELVEAYNRRIPPTHNLNLFAFWKRTFSSMLSVCDPLNLFVVGGRSLFQYGDSVRSFANVLFIKDSVFAYKYIVYKTLYLNVFLLFYAESPYFIDHIFYGINQFPLQDKQVECCILTSPN